MSLTTTGAMASDSVTILYTNHRGETAPRRITPIGREWFGSSEWHPEPQWLFTAFDMDKEAFRDFARAGVKAWGQEAVDAALAAPAPVVPEEVRRIGEAVRDVVRAAWTLTDNTQDGGTEQQQIEPGDWNALAEAVMAVQASIPSAEQPATAGHAVTLMLNALAATPSKPVGDGGEAANRVADQIWAAIGALETPERASGVEDAEASAQVLGHAVDTAKSILRAALRNAESIETASAPPAGGGAVDGSLPAGEGPNAWVIPGDDNANMNGFLDAMCYREGEFTRPLYALAAAPQPAAGGEAAPLSLGRIKDAISYFAHCCQDGSVSIPRHRLLEWREGIRFLLSAPSEAQTAGGDGWRNDPSSDERWNAGLDYGQTQLCAVLGVDPQAVSWDAATETLDGDVRSVIGNILTAWAGDNWRDVPTPANAGAEGGQP